MAKPPNDPTRLTADSLNLLIACADSEIARLNALHWSAVGMGATNPLYRNIQIQIAKIEAAKTNVAKAFEAQFAAPRTERPIRAVQP